MAKNYKQKLHNIKAFVFDMDGVLTDGHITVTSNGKPIRKLNSKDGYALQLAIKKGYIVAIISGGNCEGMKSVFRNLGITDIYMSSSYKLDSWNDLLAVYEHTGLKEENMLYMGDDIPDYEVMQRAGVACTPHNGVPEIRAIADYISYAKGGNACVRDVIEQTLKVQKNWMLKDDFSW